MLANVQKEEIKNAHDGLMGIIRKILGDDIPEDVTNEKLLSIAINSGYKSSIVAFTEGWLACKGVFPIEYNITVEDIQEAVKVK